LQSHTETHAHVGSSLPDALLREWGLLQNKPCPNSQLFLQSCRERCVCTSFQDYAGIFQFLKAHGGDSASVFFLQRSSKAVILPVDKLEMHTQNPWNDGEE